MNLYTEAFPARDDLCFYTVCRSVQLYRLQRFLLCLVPYTLKHSSSLTQCHTFLRASETQWKAECSTVERRLLVTIKMQSTTKRGCFNFRQTAVKLLSKDSWKFACTSSQLQCRGEWLCTDKAICLVGAWRKPLHQSNIASFTVNILVHNTLELRAGLQTFLLPQGIPEHSMPSCNDSCSKAQAAGLGRR